MLNLIVIGIFAVIIIVLEFIHYRERKDLYNRLMAKDLSDYKANEAGTAQKGRNGIKKRLDMTGGVFPGLPEEQ